MNKSLLEQLKILYVEDQEEIRSFTSDILKGFFKEVIIAENGIEGLELFKRDSNKFDVIVTDINMPKLDGLNMIKEMKKISDKEVPVVITTAHTDEIFLKETIKLGISSYTLKPIDLYDLVNNIIKLTETTFLKNQLKKLSLSLKNEKQIINYIEEQDSLIAIFEKDSLLYSNSNFKNLFENNFSLNNLIQEDLYFSKATIPKDKLWYQYLGDLNDIDRVCKIKINDEINTFRIDTIILDEEDTFALCLYNITKLNEKSTLFNYRASHDKITGLYNKNKFHKLFNMEVKRARRYRKDLSFIIFEITNDFYTYESTFEKILLIIANKVSHIIREHDINFKWDKSSFLIMLPETDIDGALNVAYKIEENLKELMKKNNFTNKFSFGISSLDTNDSEKEIENKLKKALEISKNSEGKVNYF